MSLILLGFTIVAGLAAMIWAARELKRLNDPNRYLSPPPWTLPRCTRLVCHGSYYHLIWTKTEGLGWHYKQGELCHHTDSGDRRFAVYAQCPVCILRLVDDTNPFPFPCSI